MSNQQEIIDGLKLDYSGDEIYQMVDGAIEQILAKKSKEERDSEPDQNKIQRFNDAARVLKQVRDHIKRDATYRVAPDEIGNLDYFLRRALRGKRSPDVSLTDFF